MLSTCRFSAALVSAMLASAISSAAASEGKVEIATSTLTSSTLTSTLTTFTAGESVSTTATTITAGPGQKLVAAARVRGSLSVMASTEADASHLAADQRLVASLRSVVAGAAGVWEAQVEVRLRRAVGPDASLRRRLASVTLRADVTIVVPAGTADAAAQRSRELGAAIEQASATDLAKQLAAQLARVAPGVVTVARVEVDPPVVDTVMLVAATGGVVVAGSTEPLDISLGFSGKASSIGLLMAAAAALIATGMCVSLLRPFFTRGRRRDGGSSEEVSQKRCQEEHSIPEALV